MTVTTLYHRNLEAVWNSLLPAPDIRIIQKNGDIKKIDLTIAAIAKHYLRNVVQFFVASALVPITFTVSTVASLFERVEKIIPLKDTYTPEAFGFSSSRFQDSAEGTFLDLSSLKGIGTGDWDKVFKRPIQKVTKDGEKIGEITHGITLREGEKLEDLFVNIIDHPGEFADLLRELGCTAYRTSLERSVMEPKPGEFSELAIQKYQRFYAILKSRGIEPWITLHHFTNPQWFEDKGGFAKEENIDGFVKYAEKMVESFSDVNNWMTFNEPGIRGLEGYVRGEHPPEHEDAGEAAQVMRNLLITHHKTYQAIKAKYPNLNIGLTHQWLRFLPFGINPIEKITAYFFTNFIHTPILNFFKEGKMHVRVPFKANVQLSYEDSNPVKFADFLGVQAYGYPRIKVGFNSGKPYPGAADKVKNFTLPFLRIGFTAGSTCEEGDRMQYFGPPAKSTDLIHVLDEAFTIPKERIAEIGISETGRDAKGMRHGERGISVDEYAQADGVHEILDIAEKYPLKFLFWWTLKRHCEWRSGSLPALGLVDLKYSKGQFDYQETPSIRAIRERFQAMQARAHHQAVA